MKSLNNYSKSSLSFVNSMQYRIENPLIVEEYALIRTHGKHIDSVFEKLNKYTYRLSNNSYITEEDTDILFVFEEQIAIRDMLASIATKYQQALIEEFCNEFSITPDNTLITEAIDITGITKSLGKSLETLGEKGKNAFAVLKDKLKAVGEFIKSLISNTIKTAKQLFEKFTDMMVTIGGNIKDLINKLTRNDGEKYYKTFTKYTAEIGAAEAKRNGKGLNTYESLANKLNSGEQITESYLANVFPIYEDEYDDSMNAKAGEVKKGMNPLLAAILQMAAYHLTVTIIPLVIFVASGGTLGWLSAFLSDIAAVAWGSVAFYRQCKHLYRLMHSKEFKSRRTIAKVIAVTWWIFCLVLSAMAIAKGASGLWDKFKFLNEGGKLSHILPNDSIVRWAERLDSWRKQFFGKTDNLECLDHYNEILQEKDIETIVKMQDVARTEQPSYDQDGKDLMKEFANKEFKNSMEAVNWLKQHGIDEEVLSNLDPNTKVYVYADGAIGNNKWSKELTKILDRKPEHADGFNQGLNNLHSNAGASTVIEMTYGEYLKASELGVMGHNNHNAVIGIAKEISDTIETTTEITHSVPSLVGQFIPFAGLMPTVQKFMKRGGFKMRLGSNRTKGHHVYLIPDNDFVKNIPYSEFVKEYSDKNPKAIKEMQKYLNQNIEAAKKAKEELEKLDKRSKEDTKKLDAITEFLNRCTEGKNEFGVLVFNTNDKFANGEFGEPTRKSKKEVKEALEAAGCTIDETTLLLETLEFDENDMIDIYDITEGKLWDKIKSGVKSVKDKVGKAVHKLKYKDDVSQEDVERARQEDAADRENKNDEQSDEAPEINSSEQYPLMFFNPLILCGGDLAPRSRTKGPRAHIYMVKGILSRLQFLPVDQGMSLKEIIDMWGNLLKEGIKACYDVTFDVPCIKKGRKFIENEESAYKDKERMDFGGLTNKQITDFMNDPDLAYKYIGGEYATDTITGGKHKYIEQDGDDVLKKHHDEVIAEFKDLFKNDADLKNLIDSSKTLKKVFFDKDGELKEDRFNEYLNSFMRAEHTYLKGDKKDGLLKRFFNLFKKEIDADPNELKDLSILVQKKIKNMKRKFAKESFDEEYYDIILEANIELFETEFDEWFNDSYPVEEEFDYINLIKYDR